MKSRSSLEKQGTFQHVYRDSDRTAANVADLVVLHSTVRGFKAGSERARQVTTVAGATSITVHCQFTSYDAKPLLARMYTARSGSLAGISRPPTTR